MKYMTTRTGTTAIHESFSFSKSPSLQIHILPTPALHLSNASKC
jgi:hypothetical protein